MLSPFGVLVHALVFAIAYLTLGLGLDWWLERYESRARGEEQEAA